MTPKCSVKSCKERPVKMAKCAAHLREWSEGIAFRQREKEKAKTKPLRSKSPDTSKYKGQEGIVRQNAPKPQKRRKANGDLKFFRELYLKWVEDGTNHCLECGKWLQGEVWNFAHVVGDGECGGNREVALDAENIVPMCLEHHNQMDNAIGRTRREMKCWERLEEIRRTIVDRYGLKVRR